MTTLTGKVALVTGASRGIGRAIAERLGRDGARVVVNYGASAAKAEETVAAVRAAGSDAAAVQADVTDIAAVRRLFEETAERFGRLDILVNNAGTAAHAPVAETTEEQYDALFGIAKGTFFALQEAARRMEDGGRIINISSTLTRGATPGIALYVGSKSAIEHFSRSLSKELGPRNITVNAVLPGATKTDLMTHASPDMVAAWSAMSSFNRLGEPQEVADLVGFLASDEGRWVTGQTIAANGGMFS